MYSFALCPEAFVAHKKAYIDLLKILQANEGQENTELQGNPTLFALDGPGTNLLPNLSTSRTDSDPLDAANLKIHCSQRGQLSTYQF